MNNKYFDLDVPLDSLNSKLIARLLDCGYQYLAASQIVNIDDFSFDHKSSTNIRKKNKEERQDMRKNFESKLKPPSSQLLIEYLKDSQQYRSNVSSIPSSKAHIFTRLTLLCSNPSLASHFFHEFGKHLVNFDIVSICPTTQAALSFACDQSLDVDLVTIDVIKSDMVRVTNKNLSSLISRGVFLEFNLAPIFRHSSGGSVARSTLSHYFNNLLCSTTPSSAKAIVISSGATNSWEVRRPIAISSLLGCLGLKPREATFYCITKAPHSVISHGLSRSKTLHGAITMLKLMSSPDVSCIVIENSHDDNKTEDLTEDVSIQPTKKAKLCE